MEIIRATKENTHLPVTLKIRLGLTPEEPVPVNIGEMASDAGACALAVHGRYRTDFFSGEVRIAEMRAITEASPLPVIANGDSTSVEAALRMRDETGASGLLIGRGAWGNPWIFRGIAGGNPRPEPGELHRTVMDSVPEPQVYHIFRGHLVQYFRGFRGAAEIRKRAVSCESFHEVDMLAGQADIALQEAMHGDS